MVKDHVLAMSCLYHGCVVMLISWMCRHGYIMGTYVAMVMLLWTRRHGYSSAEVYGSSCYHNAMYGDLHPSISGLKSGRCCTFLLILAMWAHAWLLRG